MASERYPGERRGLSLFLEDLRGVVTEVCGSDSILDYAVRRALRSHDLRHLRHARTLFNHLPREQRRRLSEACVVRSPEPAPAAHELLERYLPQAAAGDLRRIADQIEGEHHLLAARYRQRCGEESASEDAAQAPKSSS